MQKIQKFQFGRLYVAPNSKKSFELIERNGHHLTFRVRKPKDRTTYKTTAISTYKADGKGAFEEVLFLDGLHLRSDSWCSDPKKVRQMSPETQTRIIELMAALAA